MKYRIKEKNGKFYPQKKWFLFWERFPGEEYQYISYGLHLGGEYCTGYNDLFFNTLEEAKLYIEQEKEKRKIIYHEID